jgi:hypothetical protein
MARRGGADNTAQSLRDEIRDIGPPPEDTPPSSSSFTDPLRADTAPDEGPSSAPSRFAPAPPSETPTVPTPEGAGEESFDARGEVTRLRDELRQRDQRDALFQREMALRLAGAVPQSQQAPSGQAQIDPTLQEGLDILQVTEDDLGQVFQGGPQAAQVVTRALQAVYLLAVNATEKRLINYYSQDQGARTQQQYIASRAQQMQSAFWDAYPDLQSHQIVVQHYAAEVAQEQAQSPRFDWESAQREVARRTMLHLRQQYNVDFASPGGVSGASPGPLPPAGPRPTLQSRIRPVVGEMGGGSSRQNGATQRSQMTSEILDLGRR